MELNNLSLTTKQTKKNGLVFTFSNSAGTKIKFYNCKLDSVSSNADADEKVGINATVKIKKIDLLKKLAK